ncbi:hypothetical protein M3Y94_01135400 [Aphelenchoides besseyi]|nr:hypothetical protein M3Y94_01135400 [Aphelenchoides besseyi]KAI6227809.1 BTB and MATH domain-containing protein 39 [Aphelenchoides besseyi]
MRMNESNGRAPNLSFLRQMISECYHYSIEQEELLGVEHQKEMADVCVEKVVANSLPSSSTATAERPFRIIVRGEVFTVDSTKLRSLSPIFAIMCFGRDFEQGRELTREIVDEKPESISTFLRCIHDNTLIDEWNIVTCLRLSEKYLVESLTIACGNYILDNNLDHVKPDQILTLLIAAHDYHLPKTVLKKLILRLAKEEKIVQTRLRLNRFLPSTLNSAVMSATINWTQYKELERQNGHHFRIEKGRTVYKRALCSHCKRIADAAECDGCHLTLCKEHALAKCTSEYGQRMLQHLGRNIVELDWDDN